jgi:hypothetical protein
MMRDYSSYLKRGLNSRIRSNFNSLINGLKKFGSESKSGSSQNQLKHQFEVRKVKQNFTAAVSDLVSIKNHERADLIKFALSIQESIEAVLPPGSRRRLPSFSEIDPTNPQAAVDEDVRPGAVDRKKDEVFDEEAADNDDIVNFEKDEWSGSAPRVSPAAGPRRSPLRLRNASADGLSKIARVRQLADATAIPAPAKPVSDPRLNPNVVPNANLNQNPVSDPHLNSNVVPGGTLNQNPVSDLHVNSNVVPNANLNQNQKPVSNPHLNRNAAPNADLIQNLRPASDPHLNSNVVPGGTLKQNPVSDPHLNRNVAPNAELIQNLRPAPDPHLNRNVAPNRGLNQNLNAHPAPVQNQNPIPAAGQDQDPVLSPNSDHNLNPISNQNPNPIVRRNLVRNQNQPGFSGQNAIANPVPNLNGNNAPAAVDPLGTVPVGTVEDADDRPGSFHRRNLNRKPPAEIVNLPVKVPVGSLGDTDVTPGSFHRRNLNRNTAAEIGNPVAKIPVGSLNDAEVRPGPFLRRNLNRNSKGDIVNPLAKVPAGTIVEGAEKPVPFLRRNVNRDSEGDLMNPLAKVPLETLADAEAKPGPFRRKFLNLNRDGETGNPLPGIVRNNQRAGSGAADVILQNRNAAVLPVGGQVKNAVAQPRVIDRTEDDAAPVLKRGPGRFNLGAAGDQPKKLPAAGQVEEERAPLRKMPINRRG